MLKPLVPKFRPNLSARLKDIAQKQVPAKLKPIVSKLRTQGKNGNDLLFSRRTGLYLCPMAHSRKY